MSSPGGVRHSANSSGGGITSVLKTLTQSLKSATGGSSSNSTPQINPTVIGKTAQGLDVSELLSKLTPNNSFGNRVAAAELIRSSVEDSSISSIPELWYQAREMIDSKNAIECRRAGLRLLNACIVHDEHVVGARVSYYNAVINHPNIEEFDLLLQALKSLTNDGRDIFDLLQSGFPFPRILCSWLRRLAAETQDVRAGKKRDIALPWTTMEENFHNLLDYIKNTIKFNVMAFDEESLVMILREVVYICKKTSQSEDIAKCCDLIDTVLVFGYLPFEVLRDVLEILSGILIIVEQQTDQVWATIQALARGHTGNSTIQCLCEILEVTHPADVNSNIMRGAARFLVWLLEMWVDAGAKNERTFEMSISQVLKAYTTSLGVNSARHALEICNCIYRIMNEDKLRNVIPYELWESNLASPLEALYTLTQTPDLQRRSRRFIAEHGKYGNLDNEEVLVEVVQRLDETGTLIASLLQHKKAFNGPFEMLITSLLDLSAFINKDCALVVIECFEQDHYCNPLSQNWAENLHTLVTHFWDDGTWESEVRIRVIKLARDIYTVSRDACQKEVVDVFAGKLFNNIAAEQDIDVLNELLELFVWIAVECDLDSFSKLCELLSNVYSKDDMHDVSNTTSPRLPAKTEVSSTTSVSLHDASCEQTKLITRSLGHLFVLTFRYSPIKAKRTYYFLVSCCQKFMHSDSLTFLEAARLLCRIRVTTNNFVYLTSPNNMDGLAGSFGRSYSGFKPNGAEAWWYPETLSYLGKDNLEVPSTTLKRGGESITELCEIDIEVWLKVVNNIIEHGAPWEVYSFTVAHFAPQLSNLQLFCDCSQEIRNLKMILIKQIRQSGIPPKIEVPSPLARLDPLVALIRSMSSLIGYNTSVFQTKSDGDAIVQAFVLGLTSWEKTAVACIHGLVVSCYEFPLSIKKFVYQIFTTMQSKITNKTSSPHVLEFLISLSRIPSLTDNFTLDDYKTVFGMAFKYIQHAGDLAVQNLETGENKLLSQYLLALAYNVIANWFLTLQVSKRRILATFITRNLILANGHENNIEQQSLATLDLINRFTHSDLDLVLQHHSTVPVKKGYDCKRWIYGTSILTIESHLETGDTHMVMRRPTGTTLFNIRPDDQSIPQHLKEKVMLMHKKEDDKDLLDSEPGLQLFSPSYMLLQTIVPTHPDSTLKPIPLANDTATTRALGVFDRTPVVDFHKVGVLYIGPGQSTEHEILSNPTGSRAYRRFLGKLGSLVRLRGNKQVYTGGLDTENDADGEFAYAWNDKITQVIFHTTTLMPVNDKTNLSNKKRHIGNDYVNIYYDESGLPFNFNVVKSQFNFINIVVSPHTVTFKESSGMAEEDEQQTTKNYYRVRAYRKDGLPAVFAACHLKTVSETALPLFVRNLALIASKFATVWHSEGSYISNWRYRLQQINQLQERTEKQFGEEMERKHARTKAARQAAAQSGGGGPPPEFETDFDDVDVNDAQVPLLKNLAFSTYT